MENVFAVHKPTEGQLDCGKFLPCSELCQVATPVPTQLPGLRPDPLFSE